MVEDLCCGRLKHCFKHIFSLTLTHTNTLTHAALTIKPLVSFDVGVLVTVPHQLLLVLLHQAVKTVSIPSLELLLWHFNLLEKNKIKTVRRC